jgi:hypothetical protein
MEIVVVITESDYREIARWEDDGGAPSNVIYQIIPDEDEDAGESELAMTAN